MDQVNFHKPYTRSYSDISQLSPIKTKFPVQTKPIKRPSYLNLDNVRVIQDNLVYIINLPACMADEELLKSPEYFGQYGKITKCVVNKTTVYTTATQGPSYAAYITYSTHEEAGLCIKTCDGICIHGRQLTLTFGTTKYCSNFLRNIQCQKVDCLYLHQMATQQNTVLREELPTKVTPQNSLLEKIFIQKLENDGKSLLPPAKIVRDRAYSEIVSGNGEGKRGRLASGDVFRSRFEFVVEDGDDGLVMPRYIVELARKSKPCEDLNEVPYEYIGEILSPSSPDKWASDIFEVIPKDYGRYCYITPKTGS